MKKIVFLLLFITSFLVSSLIYASGGGNLSSGSNSIILKAGESKSISFSNEISYINFSKSKNISVKTLEGGIWKDVSNNVSNFKPLKGFIITNHEGEDLTITYKYKGNISTLDSFVQNRLLPGWNLIGISKNGSNSESYTFEDGLGSDFNFSQIVDFTSTNFLPYNNTNDLAANFFVKNKNEGGYLFEEKAYAIFNSNTSTLGGIQNLTDKNGNIIFNENSLNVTLNPNTPNNINLKNTQIAKVLSLDITAGSKDYTVNSVTIKLTNTQTGNLFLNYPSENLGNGVFEEIYFKKGNKIISEKVNSDATLYFPNPLVVKAGSTETIDLEVKILGNAKNYNDTIKIIALNGLTDINIESNKINISSNYTSSNNDISLIRGSKNVELIGFTLSSDNVSDIKITSISGSVIGSLDLSKVSNIRLYQGNSLLATKNDFNFNTLNITLLKNSKLDFKILADFDKNITEGTQFQFKLSGNDIIARNLSNNNYLKSDKFLEGKKITFFENWEFYVTVNPSSRTIITPSSTETSVFKFDLESKSDRLRVTDIYIRDSKGEINLASALRSSSLTIGSRTVSGVVLDEDILHFPFGSSGALLTENDQKVTADLKVSFYDSSSRSNLAFQFGIPTGPVIGEVSGTKNGMRILSDGTGTEIERTNVVIQGKEHLLARSKPTVSMSSFTPSSNDVYKFTVTADANRKINLETLTIRAGGSVSLSGGTFSVYRDNNSGASNLLGSGSVAGNETTISLVNGQASEEVAAGTTVTYYVVLTGVSADNNDKTREINISGLTYTDDVDAQYVESISVGDYNVGVPTSISSYKY